MSLSKQVINSFRNSFKKEGNPFVNLANRAYYIWRRNNWMFDLRRYWNDFEDVEINKPVFVLGFHGSGTSLLSRMIRRHKNFVSVSGNYKYWSGADEMQVVLGPILSPEFTGIKHNLPADLKPPTGWIYASDKYIDYYRKTKEDVTPELRRSFRKIIRWQIVRHATDRDKARFTDKSQVFTVKVSFINEILKDAKPKFILLVRNPYAMCYRRAKDNTGSLKNNNIGSYKKRLKVVCEHTRNSIKYAFKDSDEADLKVIRFEDVLNEPDQTLKEICNFIKVGFSERMIPQSEDKVCFGSTGKDKWYPLRPDVNEKYFDKMTVEDVEVIDSVVGETARELGYDKPKGVGSRK